MWSTLRKYIEQFYHTEPGTGQTDPVQLQFMSSEGMMLFWGNKMGTFKQQIRSMSCSVSVCFLFINEPPSFCPFRGCTEEYEMKTMEQKPEPEPLAAGYRPSPRPTWRWDSPPIPPGLHNAPNPQRWAPIGAPPIPLPRSHKALMPVPYREPQHLNPKRWELYCRPLINLQHVFMLCTWWICLSQIYFLLACNL